MSKLKIALMLTSWQPVCPNLPQKHTLSFNKQILKHCNTLQGVTGEKALNPGAHVGLNRLADDWVTNTC